MEKQITPQSVDHWIYRVTEVTDYTLQFWLLHRILGLTLVIFYYLKMISFGPFLTAIKHLKKLWSLIREEIMF